MCNLGIAFTEILALDALAADCAADGQYTFLYTAAPLKVVEGDGAPVNPIVIKKKPTSTRRSRLEVGRGVDAWSAQRQAGWW